MKHLDLFAWVVQCKFFHLAVIHVSDKFFTKSLQVDSGETSDLIKVKNSWFFHGFNSFSWLAKTTARRTSNSFNLNSNSLFKLFSSTAKSSSLCLLNSSLALNSSWVLKSFLQSRLVWLVSNPTNDFWAVEFGDWCHHIPLTKLSKRGQFSKSMSRIPLVALGTIALHLSPT